MIVTNCEKCKYQGTDLCERYDYDGVENIDKPCRWEEEEKRAESYKDYYEDEKYEKRKEKYDNK